MTPDFVKLLNGGGSNPTSPDPLSVAASERVNLKPSGSKHQSFPVRAVLPWIIKHDTFRPRASIRATKCLLKQ
jgi:hypothetical protein